MITVWCYCHGYLPVNNKELEYGCPICGDFSPIVGTGENELQKELRITADIVEEQNEYKFDIHKDKWLVQNDWNWLEIWPDIVIDVYDSENFLIFQCVVEVQKEFDEYKSLHIDDYCIERQEEIDKYYKQNNRLQRYVFLVIEANDAKNKSVSYSRKIFEIIMNELDDKEIRLHPPGVWA